MLATLHVRAYNYFAQHIPIYNPCIWVEERNRRAVYTQVQLYVYCNTRIAIFRCIAIARCIAIHLLQYIHLLQDTVSYIMYSTFPSLYIGVFGRGFIVITSSILCTLQNSVESTVYFNTLDPPHGWFKNLFTYIFVVHIAHDFSSWSWNHFYVAMIRCPSLFTIIESNVDNDNRYHYHEPIMCFTKCMCFTDVCCVTT